MAPAVKALAQLSPAVPVRDPATRMLSNADGTIVSSGDDLLARLVAQVSAPVRWDQCIATMKELSVTAVIELAPAGTLAGILRREMRGIEVVALRTPDDIEPARALVSAHSHPVGVPEFPGPAWRLVVAPVAGTFHAEPTASFGFQFRTNRHVFEIVVSNAWETNIAGSALGGPDEKHIGFNLYRRIK